MVRDGHAAEWYAFRHLRKPVIAEIAGGQLQRFAGGGHTRAGVEIGDEDFHAKLAAEILGKSPVAVAFLAAQVKIAVERHHRVAQPEEHRQQRHRVGPAAERHAHCPAAERAAQRPATERLAHGF